MIGEAMTETYDEHMAEMLRLGGAHECASDCPQPLPRTREHEPPYPGGSPQTEAGPTRRIKYSVGEYIWAEATNVTPAKAHAMAAEIDRWYAARREEPVSSRQAQPLDVERLREASLAVVRAWNEGARAGMGFTPMWTAMEGLVLALSSIPTGSTPTEDAGAAVVKQWHAAWCWLPLDHQGQCEGDQ